LPRVQNYEIASLKDEIASPSARNDKEKQKDWLDSSLSLRHPEKAALSLT